MGPSLGRGGGGLLAPPTYPDRTIHLRAINSKHTVAKLHCQKNQSPRQRQICGSVGKKSIITDIASYRFSLPFPEISITDTVFGLETNQLCNHFGYNSTIMIEAPGSIDGRSPSRPRSSSMAPGSEGTLAKLQPLRGSMH